MYLLPAGTAPRTQIKFAGMGAIRAMIANGGGSGSDIVRRYPIPVIPVRVPLPPAPMPVWNYPGGSVGLRPIPVQQPGPMPLGPNISDCASGVRSAGGACVTPYPRIGPPVTSAPDLPIFAGTPVPAGFPINQFFVAPDGSVWEYSTSGNTWVNTGTPYNVGQPASPSAAAASAGAAAAPAPVSVTVSTPGLAPASTGYQAILDWLTQTTLISPVPNWVVGTSIGLLAWKLLGSSGKGR